MKRSLKTMGLFFLMVALVLSLAGCVGGIAKKVKTPAEMAEDTVVKMFEAFKNVDLEEAQKYVKLDALQGESATEVGVESKMLMEALFDRLDYKIVSSQEIDENKVEVKLEITSVDMKPVVQDYFKKAIEYAFGTAMQEPQPTDEEMNAKMTELFLESATQEGLETITKEATVEVIKDGEEWKVEGNDEFLNALLGGLQEATEELSASFE